MMDTSSVGGELSAAYIDPELKSELGNQSVQQQIQNLTSNPELLMQAVQQDPIVQQLAAVSPAVSQVISSPDALRKIFSPDVLNSVQSGKVPDDASMQSILDVASSGKPPAHAPAAVTPTPSPASLVLEGGLRLKQVRAGDARTFPKKGDTVLVQYVGYLEDGKLFDQGTFGFQLGASQVIRGWEVALEKMSLGERAVMQVPAHVAYGSAGQGPIPPDANLLFDVDLRSINKQEALPRAA